ncbi:hypothetical protein CaCOL14_003076 [Colletotrichum acutatum]
MVLQSTNTINIKRIHACLRVAQQRVAVTHSTLAAAKGPRDDHRQNWEVTTPGTLVTWR